ncbi:unnamed protein product, partial [Didymodactylos carnosus]
MFAGMGVPLDGYESVLFELDLDNDSNDTNIKPFADITHRSQFPQEQEILFSAGTVWRIKSVKYNEDLRLWNIYLNISGNNELKSVELINQLNKQIDEQGILLTLGDFLLKTEEYDKAEYYVIEMFNELPLVDKQVSILFNYIGLVRYRKNDFRVALQYFKRAEGISNETKMLSSMSVFSSDIKENSIRNLTKSSSQFIWCQSIISIIIRMSYTPSDMYDMVEKCRSEYETNDTELQKIDEFQQTYETDQAIWWYTRDSFLFGLVSKSLLTQDIHSIIPFRLFIVDLHNQLGELHYKRTEKILKVYRVLFELDLNSDSNDTDIKPFADISHRSQFPEEQEILFSAGTVWPIKSVKYNEDLRLWSIYLKLSGNNKLKSVELINQLNKQIDEQCTLLTLGNFLLKIEEYDKAEYYFKEMLNELSS